MDIFLSFFRMKGQKNAKVIIRHQAGTTNITGGTVAAAARARRGTRKGTRAGKTRKERRETEVAIQRRRKKRRKKEKRRKKRNEFGLKRLRRKLTGRTCLSRRSSKPSICSLPRRQSPTFQNRSYQPSLQGLRGRTLVASPRSSPLRPWEVKPHLCLESRTWSQPRHIRPSCLRAATTEISRLSKVRHPPSMTTVEATIIIMRANLEKATAAAPRAQKLSILQICIARWHSHPPLLSSSVEFFQNYLYPNATGTSENR